jgi:hypothetical protein
MTLFNNELPFHYPQQMQYLYENDMRIDHDLLREILALPQDELLDDLELVLQDAQDRYREIRTICDPLEGDEFLKIATFSFHALMLLGEINCDRSLDLALNFLKYRDAEKSSNNDFIEFYLADCITEDLWVVYYHLGIGREQKLCDFFFEKNIDEFTKCPVSTALQQIALYHAEKTKEIQGYYEDILRRFTEPEFYEDESYDDVCEIVSIIVSDYVDTLPDPISPYVKELYDLNLINRFRNGTYEELIEIAIKYKKYHIKKVIDIFTFYSQAVSTWYCYNKNNRERLNTDYAFSSDLFKQQEQEEEQPQQERQQPYIVPKTVGRNDPCPCGSGKKYKKCCLGKENN